MSHSWPREVYQKLGLPRPPRPSATAHVAFVGAAVREPPAECKFNAFLCTAERDELQALSDDYPKRWHVEEVFNSEQALGWERAGTQNLNVRYGHMTMALLAQAALRERRPRAGG